MQCWKARSHWKQEDLDESSLEIRPEYGCDICVALNNVLIRLVEVFMHHWFLPYIEGNGVWIRGKHTYGCQKTIHLDIKLMFFTYILTPNLYSP
jgi:hypothetical protein